jgi:hypothetical protein
LKMNSILIPWRAPGPLQRGALEGYAEKHT